MEKVRTTPYPSYNPIGEEEVRTAAEVVKTGLLSDFLGRHDEKFLGGRQVRELERRWADHHRVRHAVAFNSGTSALIAGVGALGILPGDEVLVIAYSMCISATAPLFYDAIPVFVDIEDTFYGMDPARIEAAITPRTKALLPVDLFGQSCDMKALGDIARRHGLRVLSDTSHAPGCRYENGFAGTFADIGVYSLNQHKIIHCGEGGIAVTNDDDLARRLQLIRNHGEAVVAEMGYHDLRNIVGGNYRLGEVEAAIAIEQLKKLPRLVEQRVALAEELTRHLSELDFLVPPKVRPGSEHVYYLYPVLDNVRHLGIPLYRLSEGYVRPLYLEPIFAEPDRFKEGYPFSLLATGDRPSYRRGICPVTERLWEKELIVTSYTYPPLTRSDMRELAIAFEKAALMR